MKKIIANSIRHLALTLSIIAVVGGSVQGATKDWNPPSAGSGGSTDWATGVNWGGTAPVNDLTTDIARFDQTSYLFQPNAGTASITGIEIGDGTTATAALTLSGTSLSIGASGITKFANSETGTISSPITLGAAQAWTNNSSSTLDITGAVSGSNALTIAGSGSVTLRTATNTYSAGTTIKSGTLIAGVGSSSAIEATVFGTGAITLGDSSGTSSATLAINLAKTPTVTNAITIASGSSGTLTMTTNSGSTTMSGAIALNHDLTMSNTGTAPITYSGSITGSRDITVNTTSTGQVVFSGDNQSTWTGNLYVTSGLFRITGETSTIKSLSANNTLYIASGGTFQNNNNTLTIAGVNDLSGGGGVIDNTSNNGRALTFGGSGNYDFGGIIQNTGGVSSSLGLVVALTGSGSQTLSGTNTYVGATTINSGILNVRNSSALGSTALGTSVVANATLQLQGNISVGEEALTINGLGATGQNGALVNVSGTNSYAGQLTMGSNVTTAISSDNSGTLNLTNTGTISNANTRSLVLTGSGNGSLAGVLTAGAITKNGTGTWSLSGANSYTGGTTVSAGTLLVDGGQASANGAISVGASGALGGIGTMGGNLTTSASTSVLTPGDGGAGKFSLSGAANFTSGATFKMDLGTAATAGTTYDQLAVGGLLTASTASGGLQFDFTNLGGNAQAGTPYTIIEFASMSGFTEAKLSMINSSGFVLDTGFDTNGWKINGNDLQVQFVTVPEPATWALLAFSLTTVMVLRRRRN